MKLLSFALILFLSDCVYGGEKPSEQELDRIESRLASRSCIGAVSEWDRRYNYKPSFSLEELIAATNDERTPRPSGYDKDIIFIKMYRPGVENFRRGRKSYTISPPGEYDGKSYKYLVGNGYFKLSSGELWLSICGPNS